MKQVCLALVLFCCACSGPQAPATNQPKQTAPDVDATSDAGAEVGEIPQAELEFPFEIEVKRHPFAMLGPTDLIERSDGRAYVLLASAKGVKTGRPMAIVDLDTGDIEPTSAVPIPLAKPYGFRLADDDLFVWSQTPDVHDRDFIYVDAVYYDASADLWLPLPIPGGERMQSFTVTQNPEGEIEATTWNRQVDTANWRLDPETKTWQSIPAYLPEDCNSSREWDGEKMWAAGLVMNEQLEPCAAVVDGSGVKRLPPPPSPRCLHRVVRTDDALWLVGGFASCGMTMFPSTPKVDRLKDGAKEWEELPDLPVSVVPSGALEVDGHMLVFDHQLGVMAWMEEERQWVRRAPIEDYDNNCDWTVMAPNRVAALSWKRDPKLRDDEVVVFTFRPRGKPTP